MVATGVAIGMAACGGSTSAGRATTAAPSVTGSATSAGPATSPPALTTGGDACKYVTAAQASALAGTPLTAGNNRTITQAAVPFNYCDYDFVGAKSPGVQVAVADLGSNGVSLFAQFKQSQLEADSQDVSGVGDEAFYAHGNLNVRKGNTLVILGVQTIGSPRGAAAIPDEKRLAALVLPQI